jgi:dCMP deaminase
MNWDEYAMSIAEVSAKKSKDPWRQVGAALLRHDNSIAACGFNGFPAHMDEKWEDRATRRKYVVHAEQNALRYVKPLECRLIATTTLPCNDCLKVISSYGIGRVLYNDTYPTDESTLELAADFGIELVQLKKKRLTSYWDHSKKPSDFVVKDGDNEVHRGCYKTGERMLGL